MDEKYYGVSTPASKAVPSIRNNNGVLEFQDTNGKWNPVIGGGGFDS